MSEYTISETPGRCSVTSAKGVVAWEAPTMSELLVLVINDAVAECAARKRMQLELLKNVVTLASIDATLKPVMQIMVDTRSLLSEVALTYDLHGNHAAQLKSLLEKIG